MHLAILAVALQLRTASIGAPPIRRPDDAADSLRDFQRARSEQLSFERMRRFNLPWENGSGGRCDARVGRFCWWYDDESSTPPREPESIARRRAELIAALDSLASRHPGDDWIAGMRVHYRVEGRDPAGADSAARECRGTSWWCNALVGYAAHVHGDARRADSSFGVALAQMPDETRCQWNDIRALIPGDTRGRYEGLSCDARAAVERRYWLLGRPRLSAPANEWRAEFLARRVQGWLAERSASPQTGSWGGDAEELLLRYGWPSAWGRVLTSGISTSEPSIIGHDPSPSFAFGPLEPLLDTLATSGDDGWELRSTRSESRFAPSGVRRVAPVALQLARFRRGDSTLIATAFAARNDSIAAPSAVLAASLDDGSTFAAQPDSARSGTATLSLPATPRVAGVEIVDGASGTLARARFLFAPEQPPPRIALSDLLLFRGAAESVAELDSALTRAIPGDTVARSQPLGIFWETYGLAEGGESVDVAVTVERIDHGFFRDARQRLGLEERDTPLRMQWTDARPPASGLTGRAISLDLTNLPAGRYRLTLSVTPQEGGPARSSREVELLER